MKMNRELNSAIARNLKLKSGILAIIFALIFTLQITIMLFSDYFASVLASFQTKWIVALGPAMLLGAALCELLMFRHLGKMLQQQSHLSDRFIYFLSFIEVSFPTAVIIFVSYLLRHKPGFDSLQLLNSPPVAMYFVMIVLSSLTLNYRISLLAGATAAVEFFVLSQYLLSDNPAVERLDIINGNVKAIFIFMCGAVAAFVSYKIKEAVVSSLHAKDELIHRLDHLVHEKTTEIRRQKEQLEEKNKDITDSINYAKRIQHAQMPTEKYIHKTLSRLKAG